MGGNPALPPQDGLGDRPQHGLDATRQESQ
jgi:hypothetical protein